MRPKPLPGAVFAVALERRTDHVLERIVGVALEQDGVALARVWLLDVAEGCAICGSPEEKRCLHLVASSGDPTDPGERWNRIDGPFHRLALGAGKIGKVGATGSGMLLHDMSASSSWIVRPEWAAREGIRSFAAQPLALRGEILGVVAVFSRARIDATAFAWLRAFADHAALALAHAGAFEESERRRAALEIENACLRADAGTALGGGELIAASPGGRKLLEQIELAAPTDRSVLVLGEAGTGKELVARRVHERSARSAGPFIKLECAGVARHRLANALFGSAARTGTGAAEERPGRIEAAHRGTLFLDEVGDLPLELQRPLLGLLERDELSRVGEERLRRVDVRIVATSSRDLAADVRAGRFREDLYLRLSVFPIVVPPLRERTADVAPLVEHFLGEICRRRGRPRLVVTTRDLRALERYPWPGNGRELAAAVERAVLAATDERARFELPAPRSAPDDVVPALDWRRRERANLEAALVRTGGRIYGPGGAAELLGVPPTTLTSRVKVLGIVRRPAR